jgi:hypothetical protein
LLPELCHRPGLSDPQHLVEAGAAKLLAAEGGRAGEELVEEHAEGVNVGTLSGIGKIEWESVKYSKLNKSSGS